MDFLHVVEVLTLHMDVYFPRRSVDSVLHESVNEACPAVTFGTADAIVRGFFVGRVGSLHIVTERSAKLWMFYHPEVGRAKNDHSKDNQSRQNHNLDNNACQDKQRSVFRIYTSFSKVKHVVTPLKLERGLPPPKQGFLFLRLFLQPGNDIDHHAAYYGSQTNNNYSEPCPARCLIGCKAKY
jgi:hypothetical protein